MHCDVLTIGNAVLDILLSLPTSETRCHINPDTRELCVTAGEKIAASKSSVAAGGGAVRVATALSRLGYQTAIAADIGTDEFGKKILSALQREGVDSSRVIQSGPQTSTTVGISYQQERTLFTHHVVFSHDFSFTGPVPTFIYLAALGEKWTGAYESVATFLSKNPSVRLAFNPGHTQLAAGKDSIRPLLEKTTVLFVNKEEASLLAEAKGEIPVLLRQVQLLGPKIVVITDGKNGSYLIDTEGNLYHHAILPAQVREKTGAGDAYAAGFLAGFLDGGSVRECMRWGTVSSASVIGKLGGSDGLLTKGELRTMLERGDMPEVKEIQE